MQITLRIDGNEKTFVNDFIKARIFREALKLNEKMSNTDNVLSVGYFDELVEFVVKAFDLQFTADEVWDGVEANSLQSEIMRIFRSVLNTGGLDVKESIEGK